MYSKTNTSDRIMQLDMIRGLAVLGIFWINIAVFGLPSGAYALPSYLGNAINSNIAIWAFSEVMVEGAMRALFSCLFGASALLYLSEQKLAARGVSRVDHYYRRNMLLMLMGMLHAYVLLWPFDVLFAYGLIGMFLFPLRHLSAKTLLVYGVVLLIIGEISFISSEKVDQDFDTQTNISQTQNISSTSPVNNTDDEDSDSHINAQRDKYRNSSLQNMNDDIVLHQSSYIKIFTSDLEFVIEQQSLYMYGMHSFDIGAMMLIGMALLKLGVLQGQRSSSFYFRLMLIGFIVGIALRAPFIYMEILNDFVPDDPENPEIVGFAFSRLPIMLGYIGLFLWLIKKQVFYHLFSPLAAVGKLALTNYISQTVISIFLFYGFGLGLIGYFERYQLALLCVAIWVLQLVFSNVWLNYFRLGPLEWLWRSGVYLRWQPLRKQMITQPLLSS